jgi:pyridoxal phosphate enzyme, yggS family
MQREISEIFRRIALIKEKYGIDRKITVIAATKTVEAEKIALLPQYGITVAGENRVQELLDKYDKVKGIEWHFIGALQTNKVKYIVDKVKLIHSLDRESLADEIDRQAGKRGIVSDVLVEINIGREASKSGVLPERAEELMAYVANKTHVRLRGVMSVFPVNAPDEAYESLAAFGKTAEKNYGAEIISAGMSGDYEKAVRFGANMVRLGSAIFGKRIYV